MDQNARLTGDNFLKRSGKGHLNASLTGSSFYLSQNKVDSYPTLIQMLKSDLIQIQDMINSNSGDIKIDGNIEYELKEDFEYTNGIND